MGAPTIDEARERADAVSGSRISALLYDPMLSWGERRGNRERRRRLLESARGRVLELGAGTGLNLAQYPDGLERLVLAEPEPHMAARLERRSKDLGADAEVVRAPAEALPFADGEFDTVVSTFVLCTAADPAVALAEVARVLRPGGSLLFCEHVRSDQPRLARWQDRLHGPWKAFAEGCNCNLPTLDLLAAAGYEVSVTDRDTWRGMPPLVHPLASGRALPPNAG